MSSVKTLAVATLTIAACWLLSTNAAQAASGYVSGYLQHYQNQGNYCANDGRSCYNATYLESEFHTPVPVRNVELYIRNKNDVVIGTGHTDTNGYYNMYWSSPTMPTAASVYWTMRHWDGRFQVFTSSGATGILWFSGFNVVNGTTFSAPQNLSTATWGSAGAPHQYTNAYDGAEKMWRNSLSWSTRMNSTFSNLSIRAFSDSVPYANCGTSCAFGSLNLIQLDANAAYKPQARIMHEMGHIASYKSNPFINGGNYCYPATAGTCGWSLTTAEWRAASFEEGLATFFGDTALYWGPNPEPLTCLSVGACSRAAANNVETSTGTVCGVGEDRWALSVDRYLRDMYDTVDDPGFNEAMYRPYSEFFDVLAQFSAGTANHQGDEPWNASYTAIDNYDGRAATDDFAFNFTSLTGLTSVNQYTYNCTP